MLETSLGCRYSILLRLPYFDATQMLAVDPMHNLFLGTGKHILQFWLQREFIPKSKYGQIQAFVDKIVVPSDVGRSHIKLFLAFPASLQTSLRTGLFYSQFLLSMVSFLTTSLNVGAISY